MMMRAVLFLVVALCGRVRAQTDCEPFNTDPATGAPIASAMVTCQASDPGGMIIVQPDARAPAGTECRVMCDADTYAPAMGDAAYTCMRQPASALENGCTEMFMWVSQLNGAVPVTCSAARCETFQEFVDREAFGVGTVSCGASTPDAVDNLRDVCLVDTCAPGFTPNAMEAERRWTCSLADAMPTSTATWELAMPPSGLPCVPVTCPPFSQFLSGMGGSAPAVAGAELVSCMGTSTDGMSPSGVGDTCSIQCTNSSEGLTNTGDFTCQLDPADNTAANWVAPDGAAPMCETYQCPSFADADLTLSGSPNAVAVTPPCENILAGEMCEAECGPNYTLMGGPGNVVFTCQTQERSNSGVWRPINSCIPDVQCPRLNETVANINGMATTCMPSGDATTEQPFGTSCSVVCDDGFAPPDPNSIQYSCDVTSGAVPMAEWSEGPTCLQTCPPPNAAIASGGFNAGTPPERVFTCISPANVSSPLNLPAVEGTVCTATCPDASLGFANAMQTTVTCMAGAWTPDELEHPQCAQVQCPAFNTADIAENAVRGSCNAGNDANQCTFNDPIDAGDDFGVSCQVACMNDFVFENAKDQLYTCAAPMDGSINGVWMGRAVCNRACSEAAITASPDGTYSAVCCANRGTPCMLGDGGCAMDSECGGPLVCGVAGQSCSDAINMVDANARCCVNPPCPDFMPWAMANLPGVNFTAGDTSSCTEMANVGSVCTVTCREGYELADSSMAALTCMARGGMPPMPPMWDGGAPMCQEAATTEPAPPCSPASLTGVDAVPWAAGCCASLTGNATCAAGYGGCVENDQCTGDLICGVAGESCSDAVETAAGDMANMTRCCVMEPPPPCSPASITGMGGAWEAGCCANLPNNGTCASGYGGCADDDECTGELRCGVAGESCSDGIEEAAGDSRNATRCCVTGPTDPPANTDDPSMQAASHLETQFVTVLVAITSVITFVFVAE